MDARRKGRTARNVKRVNHSVGRGGTGHSLVMERNHVHRTTGRTRNEPGSLGECGFMQGFVTKVKNCIHYLQAKGKTLLADRGGSDCHAFMISLANMRRKDCWGQGGCKENEPPNGGLMRKAMGCSEHV